MRFFKRQILKRIQGSLCGDREPRLPGHTLRGGLYGGGLLNFYKDNNQHIQRERFDQRKTENQRETDCREC